MKLNGWISSAQAKEMLTKQLATWDLARTNFKALKDVQTKHFEVAGFPITVQFNPSRLFSSNAKTDEQCLKERKCLLCAENQPPNQLKLPFGLDYYVLCNPYPIFSEHFTIVTRKHTDQQLFVRLHDMLELSRRLEAFTLFYNGPKSGASAPDHAHFQAVTRMVMPIDTDWPKLLANHAELVEKKPDGCLYQFTHYLRNGFLIRSASKTTATFLFQLLYQAMETKTDEVEPKMNVFCQYEADGWVLIVIPRRIHRPSHFFAEGSERILTSPGGADIGGLFITSREEDFEKITSVILKDIYGQICYSDAEVRKVSKRVENRVK